MPQSDKPTIVFLNGMSPGPVIYLRRRFKQRCNFVEPGIPVPPLGFAWCLDPSFAALLPVGAVTVFAWDMVDTYESLQIKVMIRVQVVLTALVMIRCCIAGIVRGAVKKGVGVALTEIRKNKNVEIVIGFSWGAGVVTEMIKQGHVGGIEQPSVVVIAPTTAAMAGCAMRNNATNNLHVPQGYRVHTFHATDDGFDTNRDLWEKAGATTHVVRDVHTIERRASKEAIAAVLEELLLLARM